MLKSFHSGIIFSPRETLDDDRISQRKS